MRSEGATVLSMQARLGLGSRLQRLRQACTRFEALHHLLNLPLLPSGGWASSHADHCGGYWHFSFKSICRSPFPSQRSKCSASPATCCIGIYDGTAARQSSRWQATASSWKTTRRTLPAPPKKELPFVDRLLAGLAPALNCKF